MRQSRKERDAGQFISSKFQVNEAGTAAEWSAAKLRLKLSPPSSKNCWHSFFLPSLIITLQSSLSCARMINTRSKQNRREVKKERRFTTSDGCRTIVLKAQHDNEYWRWTTRKWPAHSSQLQLWQVGNYALPAALGLWQTAKHKNPILAKSYAVGRPRQRSLAATLRIRCWHCIHDSTLFVVPGPGHGESMSTNATWVWYYTAYQFGLDKTMGK